MNLFLFEIKTNIKTTVIWALCLLFMIAAGMSKYAAASQSGQSMNELISKMPRMFQTLFGVGTFDLSTAFGFYCVLFVYLVMIVTIHATLLGATVLAKEEREKTSEFLYVKPITRSSILSRKILASLVLILLLNVVCLVASLGLVQYFGKETIEVGMVVKMMGSMFLLQCLFFVIGLFCSAVTKQPKTSPALASGVLLFSFILYQLIMLEPRLNWMKVFTPYAYFNAENITSATGVPLLYFVITAFLILTLTMSTYQLYQKRDLSF